MKDQLKKAIINRKPRGWYNITVKEFERDIEFLQDQVKLIESHEPNGRNYTNKQYVGLLQKVKLYEDVLEKIAYFGSPESAARYLQEMAEEGLEKGKEIEG